MKTKTPVFDPEARERMATMMDVVNEHIISLSDGITRVCECDMRSLEEAVEADSAVAGGAGGGHQVIGRFNSSADE
jgi:hypothetical protein